MQKMSKKTKPIKYEEIMKHGENPLLKYIEGEEDEE